jgi:competence protein ComEC
VAAVTSAAVALSFGSRERNIVLVPIRHLLAVVGVAVLAALAFLEMESRVPNAPAATATTAEIRFVDVGQGDGVVMRIGNKLIVSDVGEHNLEAVNNALEKLNWRSSRTIDIAILSHPHQDHVLNFPELAKTWRVKLAVISESSYWTATGPNRAVMKAIKKEGIKPTYVAQSDKFSWGGAKWTILNPPKGLFGESKQQAGNVSIVYLLELSGKRLLFTGDIEPNVADRIADELKPHLDGKRVNVFLMTHHGANSSSSKKLDQIIRPWWVVISAGKDNDYHHPQKTAVNRLKATDGATIWCTPTNGSVTVKINAGGDISWTASGSLKAPWWSGSENVQHGKCNEF